MRTVPFNYDESIGDLVDNIRASSRLVMPDLVQNDTIRLAVTKFLRNDPGALQIYKVEPWSFTEIRASIGLVDDAPEAGSFKLRVTGTGMTGDTAAINWPVDLQDATIAAFRADVLAKLNAVAGANAARLDLPANTPVNFLYLTWTNAADDRGIELISVALVPPIDTSDAVQITQSAPKQHLVKLSQLPIVEVNTFAFPAAPLPEITPDTTGGEGLNEVQILSIPADALGAFDLAWSGVHTVPLAVVGVTADAIATALNAIVPQGDTDPSFAVELRSTRRFAISFIGPLGNADQALLALTPRDQLPLMTAIGTLPLTSSRFERALNGAPSVKLTFELVVTDGGGEFTILRLFNLINDMTGPGTAGSAEEQGAVITKPTIIYVPPDSADPFAEVAPGASFTPPAAVAAGATQVLELPFSTRDPLLRIDYRESVDPQVWRPLLMGGEFTYKSTGASEVSVQIGYDITDSGDPTATFDKSRFKMFASAPDAIIQVFGALKFLWSQCYATLPDGLTVAQKFAQVDAAIATLAGTVKIGPTSIDLQALIRAILALLGTDPTLKQLFINLLKTVITDESLLESIINAIETDSTLLALFETLIEKTFENTELIDKLVESLFKSSKFLEEFRKLVIEAFQAGGTLPAGFIPYAFADFELIVPPIHEIDGPSAPTITGSVDVTTVDGGTTTKTTVPSITNTSPKIQEFELLPSELIAPTADTTIAGVVKLADITDTHTRTASAAVNVRTIGARRGASYPSGTILGRKNGIVFPVRTESGNAWPVEMEKRFFNTQLDDGSLYLDSNFALNFTLQTQLLGGPLGRLDFIVETGTFSHEGAETRDINAVTWVNALTRSLQLTEALMLTSVAIAISRQTSVTLGTFTVVAATDVLTLSVAAPADGTKVRFASTVALPAGLTADTDLFVRDSAGGTCKLSATLGGAAINITDVGTGTHTIFARDVRTGTITLPSGVTTFTVPALPFSLRCGVVRFDCENLTDAKGALVVRVKSPSGSIAKLT